MKAKLYISSKVIGLDFESTADRDLFFANMGTSSTFGFSPAEAAEPVGKKTIHIDPSKFMFGFTWPIEFIEK